ncbi:hypothetical protein [Treponema sp. R80B11-R83G3]
MKKIFACLGVAFLIFSCASGTSLVSSDVAAKNYIIPSMKEQVASGHWITSPSENSIIIIGISGLHTKKDDEITSAKEDAARKVAMYHGVRGNIESTYSNGVNFFDYIADSKIELDYDTDIEKYIDKLTFDSVNDVFRTDNSVFVRFKYAVPSISVNFTASLNKDGRPNWTYSRDLPKIDGFLTAVGFARNQVRLKDTVKKSTEAAVARLIEGMSTRVTSTDKTGTGMGASSMIQTKSEGKINNFQIIEFWIDPKTGYVYTLAIAKQGN